MKEAGECIALALHERVALWEIYIRLRNPVISFLLQFG